VLAPRKERRAVRGKGESRRLAVRHRLADELAGLDVPEPHEVISARRRQEVAVGAEGDGINSPAVVERRPGWPAGGRLPEAGGGVLSAGGDDGPVRAECEARQPPAVLQGLPDGTPRSPVPAAECGLLDGEDRAGVRAQGDAGTGLSEYKWLADRLPLEHVPNLRRLVRRSGRGDRAVAANGEAVDRPLV